MGAVELGEGGGEGQMRDYGRKQAEKRLLLRRGAGGDAHQQRRQEWCALGCREAGEAHFDVHEREVGRKRSLRREEQAAQRREGKSHPGVPLDPLVEVREDREELGADRGVGGGEEGEEVGEGGIQKLGQPLLAAHADPQLRALQLGERRGLLHPRHDVEVVIGDDDGDDEAER